MSKIRVVNIKSYTKVPGEVLIKIDRSSVLGNPYFMKDESKRDEVCEKYIDYFKKSIRFNRLFQLAVEEIKYSLDCDMNVALGCWCSPKRCHGNTIINYITGGIENV